MQLILMPDTQLVPRAIHRLGDAFDDLRTAIYTATEVREVFPLLGELRAIAKEATEMVDLAANRAEAMLRKDLAHHAAELAAELVVNAPSEVVDRLAMEQEQ